MSGEQIAGEVHAALNSLAAELGSGAFSITLKRPNIQESPSDTPVAQPDVALTGNVQIYRASEIDGTLIQQGDRKVMISAIGEKPSTNDKLEIGGKVYAIVSVNELAPQGVALYYVVQARG